MCALLLGWGCAESPGADGQGGGERLATPPPEASAPDPAAFEAAVAVALDGEGLRFVDVRSGSTRLLPFDAPEATVREAVGRALQAAPVEAATVADCALDFARWDSGLTIWSARGHFVGWALRGDAPHLTTMSGVTIGSTRQELEDAYTVELYPSSLGMEFTAGGISGLLQGEESSSPITHLWSGQTCIAR